MDPRKRLRVVQATTPSLRLAAATPQPVGSISLGRVQTPTLNKQVQVAAPSQLRVQGSNVQISPTSGRTNVSAPPVPIATDRIAQAAKAGAGFVGSVVTPFEHLGQASVVNPIRRGIATVTNNQAAIDSINRQQNKLFGAKQALGDLSQIGLDFVAPGAGKVADKLAAPIISKTAGRVASPLLSKTLMKGLAGTIEGVPIGAAYNVAGSASNGTLTKKNVFDKAKEGGKAGGELGLAGGAVAGFGGSIINNVKNTRLLNKAGIDKNTVKYLAQEKDPNAVNAILNHVLGDGDHANVANAIAQAGKPKNVVQTLAKYINDGTTAGEVGIAGKIAGDAVLNNTEKRPGAQYQKSIEDALNQGDTNGAQKVIDSMPEGDLKQGMQGTVDSLTGGTHDLSEAIKSNQGKIKNNPAFGDAMQQAYHQSGTHDPYNLTVGALAQMKNKSDVRNVVSQLLGDNPDPTTVNRVTRKLTNATSAQEVHDIIDAETAAAQASQHVDNLQVAPDTNTEAQAAETAPNGVTDNAMPTDTTVPSSTSNQEVANPVNTSADKAATGPISDAIQQATPDTQDAVAEVLNHVNDTGLQAAKEGRNILRSEKGQRVGAARGVLADGGTLGESTAQLRGSYGKAKYQPLDISPDAQNSLYTHLDKMAQTNYFGALNTKTALDKVLGRSEGAPTFSDIQNIRTAFGDEMANAVAEHGAGQTTTRDIVGQIASTPKSLMATADFSAPLRQGGILGSRFPRQWAQAAKEATTYYSDNKFKQSMQQIAARPSYEAMKTAKLAVDGANAVTGTEEEFMNSMLESSLAKKAGVGHVVAGSDRAYTGFLTKLRADVFDKMYNDMKRAGVNLDPVALPKNATEAEKLAYKSYNQQVVKRLQTLGTFINSASGRGNLGSLERHAGLLSSVLFSPRLWKSRLDVLNPVYYAKLDPAVRKYALQSTASFLGAAGTVLGVAAAAGAHVEWDPRSADFAKIKVGNTRYDILGGLQQNIRVLAQEITDQKINSETGELATLGDGFGKPTRKDILYQFFENKENPLLSFASHLLEGKDASGNPINPATEAGKLFIPLGAQDVYSTATNNNTPLTASGLAKAALKVSPNTVGVGTQTYGGSIATSADGSKKVSVSIPKGATKVEAAVITDKATQKANVNAFKSKLSKEDQTLLGASTSNLNKYLKNGTIDQKKYDTIKSEQDKISALNGNTGTAKKLPAGIKSAVNKSFYQKYDSMNSDEQKKFLANTKVDATAQKSIDELNKTLPSSLGKFKATNQLAKDYADFENKISKSKDDIDKRNLLKTFLVNSTKQQYGDTAKSIYNEGNSADYKYFLSQGLINKSDLDQAIDIDNKLYNAGISTSLKFNKKFRNDNGYAIPAGIVGSGSGSGSTKKTKTTKAYLADYLPSSWTPTAAPKVPLAPTKSYAVQKVALGSPKASKKISIKL